MFFSCKASKQGFLDMLLTRFECAETPLPKVIDSNPISATNNHNLLLQQSLFSNSMN